MSRPRPALLLAPLVLALAGCLTSAGIGPNADAPLETVPQVDVERFMGPWYVIEHIGLSAEADAYGAVETYALRDDGLIEIDYRFREGGFDGPERSIPQTGWVHDERTGAEWRVRPFWPLSLAYLIVDLAPDYAWSVVGHPSKRWVWILAREPALDEETLAGIRARLVESGYDLEGLRKVPHRATSTP